MKVFATLFLILSILVSCNQKSAEQEQHEQEVYQKYIADSIRQAVKAQQHRRDSLTRKEIELKGELEAAEQRLQDAKGFEFLRSADEKEQQIKTLKENVEILKHNLEYTQQQLQYN